MFFLTTIAQGFLNFLRGCSYIESSKRGEMRLKWASDLVFLRFLSMLYKIKVVKRSISAPFLIVRTWYEVSRNHSKLF